VEFLNLDKNIEDLEEERLDDIVYSSGESDDGEECKWRKLPGYVPLDKLDVPED